MTTPRLIRTWCGQCLEPCLLPEPFLRAAIVGKRRCSFHCNDDLVIPGVRIQRPEGTCACGNPWLIVALGPSGELWLR